MIMATQEEIDALPDTLSLPLKTPIVIGDASYAELTFHEPTAAQLKEADKLSGIDATVYLGALSAGVPPMVIDKLPARALKKVDAFLGSFTQDARPTGKRA